MLNMLGGIKIYTVPDVDLLIKNATGFAIVDTLPDPIEDAKANLAYYKRVQGTDKNILVPYLVGEHPETKELVWYTTGIAKNAVEYDQLDKRPTINGEVFTGNMDEDKARAEVSRDGESGGYDLSIHDEDIIDIMQEHYGVEGIFHPIGHIEPLSEVPQDAYNG